MNESRIRGEAVRAEGAGRRVRALLAATAAVAVVLLAAMVGITLQTMTAAQQVEVQARETHSRIRALWGLQEVTKRYLRITYRASRHEDADAVRTVPDVRLQFEHALRDVLAQPRRGEAEQAFARQLQQEAAEVLARLEEAPQIARRVDHLWRTEGYETVLAELGALTETYDQFYRTINDETTRSGELFAVATRQIAESNSWIRVIALSVLAFGLLLTAVLYVTLIRRLALQHANQRLAAEDERRRAFFAEASHELRMPLTIIRGEAQIALRKQGGAQHETVEALGRILDQTRAVSRVLDDLFLIARAEAGGLCMDMHRLDAGALAAQAAADFCTLASEYGASVGCRCGRGLDVMADPGRLRQALSALIDNALRHTRPGVAVVVEAHHEDGRVVLAVVDDGPGIDPDIARQLFRRFRRGQTRSEGSGLGLAVVRALAEAHGGSVDISRSTGGGARVTITLPAAGKTQASELEEGEVHEFTVAG